MDPTPLPLSWLPFAAYLQEAWPRLSVELFLLSPELGSELLSQGTNHQEENPFVWDMPWTLEVASPLYEAMPLFFSMNGLEGTPLQNGLNYAYNLPPSTGLNKNPTWLVRLDGGRLPHKQKQSIALWLHKEKIRQRMSRGESMSLTEMSNLALASKAFFDQDKDLVQEIFPLCGLAPQGWLLPYLRRFASLSQKEKEFLDKYSFPWKELPTIFALPQTLRQALIELLWDYPPSQSLSRELFALAEDNTTRKTRSAHELIADIQGIRERLEKPKQAPAEPAQHQARKKQKRKAKNTLLSLRNQWRQGAYPEQARYEQKLQDFLHKHPAPTSVKMSLPKYYEAQQNSIKLTFESPEQIKEIADYLYGITREPSFGELFVPQSDRDK